MIQRPIREIVVRALSECNPGVDFTGIADTDDLSVVLGLKGPELIRFAAKLDAALAVRVPQTHYPCLNTIGTAIAYLTAAVVLADEDVPSAYPDPMDIDHALWPL